MGRVLSGKVYCINGRRGLGKARWIMGKLGNQAAELSVLIIILAFFFSATSKPRLVKTVSTVSTTRLKLLAAPRSWVKRAMAR
jgi:hypothetical protein